MFWKLALFHVSRGMRRIETVIMIFISLVFFLLLVLVFDPA